MPARTRDGTASVSSIDPITGEFRSTYYVNQTKESIDWQPVPGMPAGYSSCSHYKITGSLGGRVWSDTVVGNYHNPGFWTELPTALFRSRSPHIKPKSAQNNNFELLNFLGELKEALKNLADFFTGNFKVGYTSYGAYTWGAMPLFNDVRHLLQSVHDLSSDEESGHIHKVRSQTYKKNGVDCYIPTVFADGITRISGEYSVSLPSDFDEVAGRALRALDELGVHPDVKTAWDLIPLSFVVDYLIPIGDLLDHLHPRGWNSYEVHFTGWLTVKYFFSMSHWDYSHWGERPSGRFSGRVYERGWYDGISAPEEDAKSFLAGYDGPSFRELFNSLYILGSMRGPSVHF